MLMMPGPTPVPEAALLALAKHPIGHRTEEFSNILVEVTANLKWLHQTQNDVLILNVSGTGAVEAGIINFLSAGDRILVAANGKFGQRWVEVSQAYGLNVETITAEWGKPLDPSLFAEKLQADTQKQIKAVVITHSETSTGVLNDLESINHHVKEHGTALIIVDAITSLGVVNLPVDTWGLDVVVSSSQKAYMTPPGIGFVCVSPNAWSAYQTANLPKYYLDLGKYRQAADKDTTPFSPPVNLIMALQTTLRMLKAEGLESIFTRHERLKNAARAAIKGLNLPLLVEDSFASPALTAVAPQDIEADKIRLFLKQRFDLELAGGQDYLKNKIFRIGHLGFVSDRDILTCIASLEVALSELGYTSFVPGAGVASAAKVFSKY